MANNKNMKTAQEEIYSQFMNLRNEQRNLVNNLSTLELDLKEHKYVAKRTRQTCREFKEQVPKIGILFLTSSTS